MTRTTILLLISAMFSLAGSATPAAAGLSEGQKAIAFKGTDFLTDAKLDLREDLGKRVILIEFGSIYCSSCMVSVPYLIKLAKKHRKEDLAIYNIYLDVYNPQRAIKLFRGIAKDSELRLLIDENLVISRKYGVDNLPTTYIIDRGGTIHRRIVGYTEADEKQIEAVISRLVQDRSITSLASQGADDGVPFMIFTPESFVKTTQDRISVVGYLGGPDAKEVSLRLNNLPERASLTKNNVFHFQTPLTLAMNFIELKGQVEKGRVQTRSLVVFREIRMGDEISSDLPGYTFHREEAEQPCTQCHILDIPLQERSTGEQSEICARCHTAFGKKLVTHDPLTEDGCLPCHDDRSFPHKYELRSPDAELCFTCHEAILDDIQRQSFAHGPVASGFCVICHDPHAANERFLLVKPVDRLCLNCHNDKLQEFTKPVIHEPFLTGRCTRCHDPHASYESMFLIPPKDSLCLRCHDLEKVNHLHKINAKVKGELRPGTPLNKDRTTSCSTCHLHHASSVPHLLKGPKEECSLGCHNVK